MSPTRAQNQVRKHWGIGKGALHKRMRETQNQLYRFARVARWGYEIDADMLAEAHLDVEGLAADSVIATAYREAGKEKEEIDIKTPLGASP